MTRKKITTENIEQEIKRILSFPDDSFIEIIRDIGFECDLCGKCCTKEFNDHVFLLDDDAERIIRISGKDKLEPAPFYDFCDNFGRFYVLGYALKSRPNGDCTFYTSGRCEQYDMRPSICRIYPYMLHREEDEEGHMDWRQISGLNLHGLYHNNIDNKTCRKIVKEVKKYEVDFLKQKARFLHVIDELFTKHALSHSRKMYDLKMRDYMAGKEIEVHVFFHGKFARELISKQINKQE
ncbi:MAG TPA: YkgJ family cysteine cluster protein [Candidatus Methanoperedens sp.]